MTEFTNTSSLSIPALARLHKYGSTVDAANVQSIIDRIADYPEIIEAVHKRDATMSRTRPVFERKVHEDD